MDINRNDIYKAEPFVEFYEKNTGWVYGTDAPFSAELTEDAPQRVDEQQYRWLGVGRYNKEAKIHYTDGRELTMASLSSGPGDYEFFLYLGVSGWRMDGSDEPAKLTTSSPNSSASSSGAPV